MRDDLLPEDDRYYQAPRLTILLIHYRGLAKLSQSDVQYYYGITQAALSDWETGKHKPTDTSLQRLALAYAEKINEHHPDRGVTPDRIFAHLMEARDQSEQPHMYDLDVSVLADHVQAYPRPHRGRVVRLIAAILEQVDTWLKT